MAKKLIELVKKQYADAVIDSHSRLGNDTIVIEASRVEEILLFVRDHAQSKLNLLRDLTCVDYLHRVPRFEVVYVLYSMELKHQLIVRALVDGDKPVAPTASVVYPIAGWMEREVWDMYGVHFEGHPDLRRVLLYEEFEGHPLRKDYAIQASQPRVALRARERDSVEEFKTFVQDKGAAAGSRDKF